MCWASSQLVESDYNAIKFWIQALIKMQNVHLHCQAYPAKWKVLYKIVLDTAIKTWMEDAQCICLIMLSPPTHKWAFAWMLALKTESIKFETFLQNKSVFHLKSLKE